MPGSANMNGAPWNTPNLHHKTSSKTALSGRAPSHGVDVSN